MNTVDFLKKGHAQEFNSMQSSCEKETSIHIFFKMYSISKEFGDLSTILMLKLRQEMSWMAHVVVKLNEVFHPWLQSCYYENQREIEKEDDEKK